MHRFGRAVVHASRALPCEVLSLRSALLVRWLLESSIPSSSTEDKR